MAALRRSAGKDTAPAKAEAAHSGGRPKGMLTPIAGKKQAKETEAKKPAARPQRKSA
jgi:DNA end-binding protein Ku